MTTPSQQSVVIVDGRQHTFPRQLMKDMRAAGFQVRYDGATRSLIVPEDEAEGARTFLDTYDVESAWQQQREADTQRLSDMVAIETPYRNEQFISALRAGISSARWDKANGVWRVPQEEQQAAHELFERFFGQDNQSQGRHSEQQTSAPVPLRVPGFKKEFVDAIKAAKLGAWFDREQNSWFVPEANAAAAQAIVDEFFVREDSHGAERAEWQDADAVDDSWIPEDMPEPDPVEDAPLPPDMEVPAEVASSVDVGPVQTAEGTEVASNPAVESVEQQPSTKVPTPSSIDSIHTPSSIEREKGLLGSLINNERSSTVRRVADIISPEDFYLPAHGIVFEALVEVASSNEQFSGVELFEKLRERGDLMRVNGVSYLHDLMRSASPLNPLGEADEIARLAGLRRVIDTADKMKTMAAADWEAQPLEVIRVAQNQLAGLKRQVTRLEGNTIGASTTSMFDDLMKSLEGGQTSEAIGTGFESLDAITGGLHPGQLTVLAARPGVGKTTFALDMVRHMAINEGKHVVMLSLEMTQQEICGKLVAAGAGVDHTRLMRNELSEQERERVVEFGSQFKNSAITIVSDSRQWRDLENRLRVAHARGDVDAVVIDYLQLAQGGRGENRQAAVQDVVERAKDLARELNIPVVACAQLNRNAAGVQGNRKPQLEDLRESGAIEQSADVVLLMHRNAVGAQFAGDVEVAVAKNRHGEQGTFKLKSQLDQSRFVDAGAVAASVRAESKKKSSLGEGIAQVEADEVRSHRRSGERESDTRQELHTRGEQESAVGSVASMIPANLDPKMAEEIADQTRQVLFSGEYSSDQVSAFRYALEQTGSPLPRHLINSDVDPAEIRQYTERTLGETEVRFREEHQDVIPEDELSADAQWLANDAHDAHSEPDMSL